MLVKFFARGTGSGAGPIDYLLGKNREREGAKLLYGDPVMTEQLINANPFKQKYKSGVLSFTEQADQFTDKQKFDIMQRFEDTLFTGLEPDQFDILWVEHSDKEGRLELNFVIPCQELRSGKSFQPFYARADLVRVNSYKNIINQEYGLTNPDDPERKRQVNPYINNAPRPTPHDPKAKKKDEDEEIIKDPPSHQLLKEAIDRQMLKALKQRVISKREGVIYLLTQWGLTIERQGKTSISISHPSIRKNIRLKGALYEQEFNGIHARPQMVGQLQREFEDQMDQRKNDNLKTWEFGMNQKEKYHKALYSNIQLSAPFELDIISTKKEVSAIKIPRPPMPPIPPRPPRP